MPTQKDIGKKIKELRLSKNMSQDRFGKRVGISGKSISAYENGTCVPSLKVMDSISNIYGEVIFYNSAKVSSISKIDTILAKLCILKNQLKELEDSLKEELSL